MTPILDTNIIIDFINGRSQAANELERYESCAVSIMTWIETLVGAKTEHTRNEARKLLALFEVVELSPEIAEQAVHIRSRKRIALPDAIIWATAKARGTLLITRNEKDFDADEPDIRIPYRLK